MAVQGTLVHRKWTPFAASALLVGAGVFLLKLCVLDVLDAAHRHEPVSVSLKGVVLAPTMIVLGVAATVASFVKPLPEKGSFLVDPTTRKLSAAGWALVITLLAVGGGLYVWLRSELSSLGYEF